MNIKVEKGVRFPKDKTKELVNFLLQLKEGDSVYLSYNDLTKTQIQNSIASARGRMFGSGLLLRTIGYEKGRRVWVFKEQKRFK